MTPNVPEDKLPAYVYAAASAARMLGLNLWTLPAADRAEEDQKQIGDSRIFHACYS